MATAADIPALVQRLRGSSRVAQLQALKQLSSLAISDETQCEVIMAAGVLAPVVQLPASGNSPAVQTAAAGLLAVIFDGTAPVEGAAAIASAILPLVAMVQRGSAQRQAVAAGALASLARLGGDHNLKADIVGGGAIRPLVQLLDCTEDRQRMAIVALFWLAKGSQPCSAAIAEAGAIPTLVRLIPGQPGRATAALAELAYNSDERREAIAAADVGAALQRELLSGSEAAREAAATLLASLSDTRAGSRALQTVAEAVDALLKCLNSCHGDEFTACNVLHALGNLVWDDPPAGAQMLAAGLLPSLLRCLQSSSTRFAARAAWVVSNLADKLPTEREAIGAAAGLLASLVGLVQGEEEVAANDACWALHNLALDCPANRNAIVAAGGFEALASLLQGSSSTLGGAAAVALCSLALGSERLSRVVRAAGAAAAIEQALPAWQAGASDGWNYVEASLASLDFLRGSGTAPASR